MPIKLKNILMPHTLLKKHANAKPLGLPPIMNRGSKANHMKGIANNPFINPLTLLRRKKNGNY
jgi:hypothetical protein